MSINSEILVPQRTENQHCVPRREEAEELLDVRAIKAKSIDIISL